MKKYIGAAIAVWMSLGSLLAQQSRYTENFIVLASDDTVTCKTLNFKRYTVDCSNGLSKDKHDNETIRSVYRANEESFFAPFYSYYGKLRKKKPFPLTSELVASLVTENIYPGLYDFLPKNPEINFFERNLFELLAYKNGYKLFALDISTKKKTEFQFYVIKEYEATGALLDKKNVTTELKRIFGNCAVLNKAADKDAGFFANPNEFLKKLYNTCN